MLGNAGAAQLLGVCWLLGNIEGVFRICDEEATFSTVASFSAGMFVTHIVNLEYDKVLMRHLEKADDLYNLRKHSVPTAAAFPMDVSVGGPAERAQALSATTVGLTPANPVFQNIQTPNPADQRPRKKPMHRKRGIFV